MYVRSGNKLLTVPNQMVDNFGSYLHDFVLLIQDFSKTDQEKRMIILHDKLMVVNRKRILSIRFTAFRTCDVRLIRIF